MANLEKMSSTERLDLCRKYFFIGLLFLPLVWLVNCVWFYKYAFCFSATNSQEKRSIKKYVTSSFVGLMFWIFVILIWLYIYTVNRAYRANWAEQLTFIMPLGRV